MENKQLDYIQAIIARLNNNSFMIKGWTITICTAVLTLSGTLKEPIIAMIALVPIFVFLVLDSYYLADERCFVSLYSAKINGNILKVKNHELSHCEQFKTTTPNGTIIIELDKEIEIKSSTNSLDFAKFRKIKRNNWQDAFKSKTLFSFYMMLIGFSLALFTGLLISNKTTARDTLQTSNHIQTDSFYNNTEKPNIIINNKILNNTIIKKNNK